MRCLDLDETEPLCSDPRHRGIVCVIRVGDFGETEFDEDADDFIGFEDGNVTHDSSDGDVLDPDKLGLQYGFTIFQKHCNNIVQVVVDFIQRFPLGMGAGETGNKTNEQARLWAALNYR